MPLPRLALTAAAAAAALIFPSAAAAVPPPNDNYLASTSIVAEDGSMPLQYSDTVDTTEATTQADTFNPNRDGQPFGGGVRSRRAAGPDSRRSAAPRGGTSGRTRRAA